MIKDLIIYAAVIIGMVCLYTLIGKIDRWWKNRKLNRYD